MSKLDTNDYDALRDSISERYNTLSKRLRDIAKFALEHPTDMALETIAVISKRAEVPPSALIRFSQAFGFSGFTEMQRTFQSRVFERSASYKERVRNIVDSDSEDGGTDPNSLLRQYCDANIMSLEELRKNIDSSNLEKATKLLNDADTIYLMAQRRAFPVATYLFYALCHSDRRTCLLDGSGGMLSEQAQNISKQDILLTTSFHPYSSETNKVSQIAKDNGIPVIAITDSTLNPIARLATISLVAHDTEVLSFRSLNSSMCIAQTLATALAFFDK
jgi:DNA-binding MurR/RpiR family transcriptional regulator